VETPLLVSDLAIVLVAAGACAFLFHRLGQPLVLGYICAGLLVGPHLLEPGLVRDPNSIETLGKLGVIFLLFSLGLDFNLSRLRRVGFGALVVGLLEIPLMLLAGYHLGALMGWDPTDRLFLGAVVAISGTTIIVKILNDLGRANQPSARLIYGVLVIEDILAILILAALSAMATTGSTNIGELAITGLGVAFFLILTAVAGSLFVPRIIRLLAERGSREMLVIAVMGVLFAVAFIALELGYSVALGAFIAGAVVGETREVRDVERLIAPMKDVFGAVFFVSVGLRIDPAALLILWAPILAVSSLVIVGKVACCSFGSFVAGYGPRTALSTGMGLAQIGEFSFIIAQSGIVLGVITEKLYALTVGVSVLTIIASPHLIRASDRLVDRFERRAPAPLVTYLELYGQWVRKLRLPGSVTMVLGLVWKPLLQTILNLLAAVGILLGATWLSARMGGEESEGLSTALLTGISLLAMPFVIASWRKTRAIGLILAEAALAGISLPEPRALALRSRSPDPCWPPFSPPRGFSP
jgi:CPA2 family monovalent cation:H+ antiporter-2